MAQRRMFSKLITDSDLFLEMPLSSQALYFHLNMHADDDGFVGNAKTIKRMVGSSEDDLKLLVTKGFLIIFPDGITVIKDWHIHNYIQKDRYHPTIYVNQKKELAEDETKSYQRLSVMDTDCIQDGYKMDTEVRLGKVRLGKDSKEIYSSDSVQQEPLQCNGDVTEGNTEIEKEKDQDKKQRKEVRQIQKPKSDSSSSLQDNFNKLWSLYPTGRKQGRKKAFAAYQRAVKNGTTNKEIQDGIVNYKKEIEIQKTPINYIKQGSTWFFNECWSDEYNFTPPVQKRNGREVVQKEALPDWANDQVEQEEQTAEQKQKKAELNKEIQRRLAEIKES